MTIGYDDMVRMLRSAAAQIRLNHPTLSKYDSVGGDGDHGTTMVRAMACLDKAVDGCSAKQIQPLLSEVGWAIMGVDGGATGPLLGTFFMSMSEAAAGKDAVDCPTLAKMFDAALAGVQQQTRARVGDKTMMDALVPAVAAIRQAADAGADIPAAVERGLEAAKQGAASTSALPAKFGRAKNFGDKSIGTPDAGATSISFIFQGFFEGIKSHG